MARQARSKSPTGIYHVMLRGNVNKKIFLDDDDKEKLVDIMLQKKDGSASRLYAYCVMANHVHAVIQEVEQPLEKFMKRICVTYAAYFNKKYNLVGSVFQDRFRSETIEDEDYLLKAIKYIHNNPLAENHTLTKYPWSSYPAYIGSKETSSLLPEMEYILSRFACNRENAVQLFCEFHLIEEQPSLFLDISEENFKNAEELIKSFLQSRSMLIGDLKKNENRFIVKELAQLLTSQCKISCRQIAKLIDINREKVRKIVV